MSHPLLALSDAYLSGRHFGITSVCSAHPLVIEAALTLGRDLGKTVLIEATCNQVNQDGGYTGMTPADFRGFVEGIAARVGFDTRLLVLGGDHLGPNPWKALPAEQAMDKARTMIAAYAAAGFTKLHLDCSMGCAGEPVALDDAETAARAADLCKTAERHKGSVNPVYVIGTEVPVPGGATHGLDGVELTTPAAVAQTHEVHRQAFAALGLADAFQRVIALVVQPGVEFGHTDVVHFDPAKAQALSASLDALPGIVFEAHSTDYQRADGLHALVADGFAILKVGPWLTFALREALYALDGLADVLDGHEPKGRLMAVMEAVMQAEPGNWQAYYHGSEHDLWLQRHFSFSDRIRYYWPAEKADGAVKALLARLEGRTIPATLRHQFFPGLALDSPEMGARDLLLASVRQVLKIYDSAV